MTVRLCRASSVLASLVLATPLRGSAQALEEFLAAARRGTSAFQDRAAAIAAGYRAAGPESPAMGQHWIHPSFVLAGTVDPARPQILSYATIAGRPVLVGVAYAVLAGDPIPDGPTPRDAWHLHDGTIMDEAVQPDHDAHPAQRRAADQDGLAVLHAWLYLPNPAGTFGSDNWSLPFVRAGLTPPTEESRDAARAVSLAVDGGAFYAEQLARHGGAGPLPIPTALAARADTVRHWLAARKGSLLSAEELAWLARLWQAGWAEVVAAQRHGPSGR